MSKTLIKDALEKARLIVSSHGLVNHMPTYSRDFLGRPVENDASNLQFDFLLDPKRPSYAGDNFSCTILVYYGTSGDIERDGGIYRDYKSKVVVRANSVEMTPSMFRVRENMVASLLMLCEMIDDAIPKQIMVTVFSAEELAQRKQLAQEQETARRIYNVVGKECIKNLRVGKRPKLTRIPNRYAEVWERMPELGQYRFYIAHWSRRNGEKDRKNYVFNVMKHDEDSYYVSARRIS